KGVRPIGTKWVLKNKKDERGIVIRNKTRLVAQGHTQEKRIDYDEMDVKSAFMYGIIDEEVYVMQPPGFQDLEYPTRVYKVEKAMYGLHQAPRAGMTIVATSRTEAEYSVAACCCRQVPWIQNQLLDYRLSMPCENLSKEISTSILRLLHTAKTFDLVWIWLGGDYGNVFLNGV
nr:retrovirus-related Pol polyprotein from transposon TNT 1-94 [Tanacetum cinerariifolium]